MIAWAASSRIVEPVDEAALGIQRTRTTHVSASSPTTSNNVRTWPSSASPTPMARAGTSSSSRSPRRAGSDRRQQALHPHRHLGCRAVLKDDGGKPDAMFIAGSGHAGGVAAEDAQGARLVGDPTRPVWRTNFLRVCGADCEGTLLPAGPVLVAEQPADNNPVKASAMTYIAALRGGARQGQRVDFGAHAWDSGDAAGTPFPRRSRRPARHRRVSCGAARAREHEGGPEARHLMMVERPPRSRPSARA